VAILFVASCAMLGLAAVLAMRAQPGGSAHAPPLVADPEQRVAALSAERLAPDGGTLVLRLTTLHAEPERQAFEARALRQRFQLGEGEPFRVTLRGDAQPNAARAATGSGFALPLGAVEVRGERDRVVLASIAADGAEADPVAAVFRAPSGELRPGETAAWVLWGRWPDAGARLLGLDGGEWPLQASSVRRGELAGPLARLDRAQGKNGQPRASTGDRSESASEQR
jgi:hypothetical protein